MLTPEQINEIRQKAGRPPLNAVSNTATATAPVSLEEKLGLTQSSPSGEEISQEGVHGVAGVAVGAGKGLVNTLKNTGELAARGLQYLPGKAGEFFKGAIDESKNIDESGKLAAHGGAEKVGKFAEGVAEFAVPGSKVSKLTKGTSVARQLISRALSSGGVAALQSGGDVKEITTAGGAEIALGAAGKIASPLFKAAGRLLKGLGAGLSGQGTDIIEQIAQNPQLSRQMTKELEAKGASSLLKKNAEIILNGVSQIKKEARAAFRTGLEGLAETDINPTVFRENTQAVLDQYGSALQKGKRVLQNVEFDDPKNIKKASDLIDRLSNAELNGKSLRKLADDIEAAKYKTATSDERLAFNAFLNDLSGSLKKAVNQSTNKLDDINKTFSEDVQIAEAIEQVFGKVKFKNLKELNKVSQSLETLFSKKGLSPEIVDDFLNRLGVNVGEFKTREAVRQISTKTTGANTKGLSVGELIQQVTSSVVTPSAVREIAIRAGATEKVISKILNNVAPTARAAIVKALIGED